MQRLSKYFGAAFLVLSLGLVAVPPVLAHNVPDFTEIVKDNSDAVVNIATTQIVESHGGPFDALPPGHPFRRFFKRFGDGGQPHKQERTSLGSGFIISDDGYVLTNAHVIKGADEIIVELHGNRQFEAKVIGMDKPTDVGLLKIDADDLPTVEIGDSNKLQVGQWVLAIGTPFGLDYTATQGIVSALKRSLPNDTYTPFIQTDVAVNPGNSGGPLFNGKGQVVGVNSQIFSSSGGYMGLSFAVPINTAMRVVKQLKATGTVKRGFLGVSIQPVTPGLAHSFGLERPTGALVADIIPDSPAAQAGLQPGDVILQFNGQKVDEAAELPPMVGSTQVGTTAKLLVLRNHERQTVEVKLMDRSKFEGDSGGAQQGGGEHGTTGFNVAVRELTPAERSQLGLEDQGGLLVQRVGEGALAEAGIRAGDVLVRIGDQQLSTAAQLRQTLESLPKGEPVPVRLYRNGQSLFVSLTIPKEESGDSD